MNFYFEFSEKLCWSISWFIIVIPYHYMAYFLQLHLNCFFLHQLCLHLQNCFLHLKQQLYHLLKLQHIFVQNLLLLMILKRVNNSSIERKRILWQIRMLKIKLTLSKVMFLIHCLMLNTLQIRFLSLGKLNLKWRKPKLLVLILVVHLSLAPILICQLHR